MSMHKWMKECFQRLLDGSRTRLGSVAFIGTPAGMNSFYDLYEKAKGDPAWYTCIYKASETNLVPKTELEEARN